MQNQEVKISVGGQEVGVVQVNDTTFATTDPLIAEPGDIKVTIVPRTTGRLSPRQLEVLRGIADGLRNEDLAQKMNISVKTVEAHRARVFKILEAKNAPHAVMQAIRRGILKADIERQDDDDVIPGNFPDSAVLVYSESSNA